MIARAALATFLTLGLALIGTQAPRAQFNGCPPGFCSTSGNNLTPYAGGLGDVVTGGGGPRFYWGLRAPSIARTGLTVVNACNTTGGVDVECQDFSTNGTTGDLVFTDFAAGSCASLGANCKVKTLYERAGSGGTPCTGNCDMTQATVALRPQLVPSCQGGKPCMRCTVSGGIFLETAGTAPVIAQQVSVSAIGKHNVNTSAGAVFWADNAAGGPEVFYGGNAANQASIFAGASVHVTSSDLAWHTFQSVFSGTNSLIQIDSTSTGSLSAGTNGVTVQRMFICNDNGGPAGADLDFGEVGLWGTYSFTGSDLTNLNSNQRTYWGF